jgi:ribosomal protein S18 acetylase RimI-like enzyme
MDEGRRHAVAGHGGPADRQRAGRAGDQQVRVCPIGPDDWAALRDVRLAALRDSPAAFGSTLEQELTLREQDWRQRTQSAAWFVARAGGEPAGLVAVFPVPESNPAATWHLVSMWASPRVRGRGVAGLLMDAAAAHVAAAGAGRLTLWVADGNDRAHAFYRRAGFRPTGRRQTYRRSDSSEFGEQELVLELAELAREI